MAYLNKNNMMEGEQVIAQARFHYMLYWVPALLVLLAIALPFIKIGEDTLKIRLIFSGVFLLLALIWAVIINNGKRFILTNKRLILKTGIIMRESNELMLRKCEGIKVRQTIMGRILNYGDVQVSTGEEVDTFKYIWNPVGFSTKVNEQIDKISSAVNMKSNNTPIEEQDLIPPPRAAKKMPSLNLSISTFCSMLFIFTPLE